MVKSYSKIDERKKKSLRKISPAQRKRQAVMQVFRELAILREKSLALDGQIDELYRKIKDII